MTRRVAVVTSSRADYSHLYWPLRLLSKHPEVDLRLIVMASHLAPEFGVTIHEIEKDGFPIAARVESLLSSDTDIGMAKSIGVALLSLADVLGSMRPDLLLLIADRYEMLAPASTALALRIPIAHIEGGEISEGAVDDAVRNALTKMSHLHFTSTEAARARVIAMGEEPWRVHRSGAPSLDHLRRSRLLSREEVESRCGLRFSSALRTPVIVIAYHPVTLEHDTTVEAAALFDALDQIARQGSAQLLFCYPNADAGSRALIDRARSFLARHAGARLFVNLDAVAYWSLLREADAMIGNSSSGIMETASFALPTVNVGLRQRGRERARNVLDAAPDAANILARVEEARSPAFRASLSGIENPYGDGHAAERIVQALTSAPLGPQLLIKRATPLPGFSKP
jgi:UDP-hydrolysing UDP-N-acetyl-D-glucosamine 2-epimerase